MRQDIHDLIIAHLNGETTNEQAAELSEWIRADKTNAKAYAEAALMHGHLRSMIVGQKSVRESGEVPVEIAKVCRQQKPVTSERRPRKLALVGAGILVAVMLIAAAAVHFSRPDDESNIANNQRSQEQFATIEQLSNVEWPQDSAREEGDRLGSEGLRILGGVLRVRFNSGVEVTLQGPAQYHLESIAQTRLESGLLSAVVPDGAEGFVVETPDLKVVDLGTAFGIQLDDDGDSVVSVFDGKVEVHHADESKQLLTEGQAVRLSRRRRGLARAEYDTAPFEKVWPVSSGIEKSTGAFEFLPPWPQRSRAIRSDTNIYVATQSRTFTLPESLAVNISVPGRYARPDDLTPSQIPAGTAFHVFSLHYQPERAEGPGRYRASGSITFNRPVLGVITQHDELAAGMLQLDGRVAGPALEHRQLELASRNDMVILSEDRKTLTITLDTPARFTDLVKVVVSAPSLSSKP